MNDITFKVINGLNRKRANEDHISALVLPIPLAVAAPKSGYKLSAVNDFLLTPYAANAVARYQVNEFFRLAGDGAELWVFALNTFQDADFARLTGGKVRQIGIQTDADLAQIGVGIANYQAFATRLDSVFRTPAHIIIAPKTATIDTIANPPDLRALNAPCISVLVSGDGGNRGLAASPDFVPALGAVLGLLAARKVSESIAWVEKCRIDDGVEYQTIVCADGKLMDSKAQSVQDTLDQKGYLILRKFANFDGVYLNDSPVCNGATQDLAYIEANRTMQKARREIRNALIPFTNAPALLEKTGMLAVGFAKHIEGVIANPLSFMRTNGELSDFAVAISENQTAAIVSDMQVSVQLLPMATLRKPVVSIGYVGQIQNL